jgi:dipeptidyl aminopeptidase/acylaminoacyl peptidase
MLSAEHDGITGVIFDTDGHRLLGTLYLARGYDPKPTALLLHGCPGLEQNADLAVTLRDRGWNSLVFHYRGCWGSEGQYDLRMIPRDVEAAVGHLDGGSYPGVDPRRLAVVGHSLGGWAAVLAAAADPRLRAVAVYGSVVDIGAIDLTASQIAHEMTRFLATTPEDFIRQRDEVIAQMDPFDAVRSISPRPLLIVHGTDDRWIPAAHARRLHAHAGQPSRYVEIDGANHDFAWHRAQLRDLVVGWLDEADI